MKNIIVTGTTRAWMYPMTISTGYKLDQFVTEVANFNHLRPGSTGSNNIFRCPIPSGSVLLVAFGLIVEI